jgi:hypothetical protein
MSRRRFFHFIAVFIVSFTVTFPLLAQEKMEAEGVYTIKKGDTLWEISSNFLKDPFLWPKLWQRNPYITNPHWIYAGQPIRLTPLEEVKKEEPKKQVAQERTMVATEVKTSEVRKVEETRTPFIEKREVVLAEVKRAEEKPPHFFELRSSGFFSGLDYRGIGIILESKEGKSVMANGDICYVAFKTSEPVRIGDRYTIFRQTELGYPEVTRSMGFRYDIAGNMEIIDQYGSYYTALIFEAFQEIYKGDRVQPYSKERMEIGQGKK